MDLVEINFAYLMDDRWQASEKLKDLLIKEKRSHWPMVLGVFFLLAVLAAGSAWFYLPPEKRPPLDQIGQRMTSFGKTLLNAPIMKAPANPPAQNSPASAKQENPPPAADDSNTLLSK